MIKTATILLGLTIATTTFSAELLQPNNNCDVQQKAELCVNSYCTSASAISASTNCTQICQKCAKAACEEYGSKPGVCKQISL